MTKRKQYKPDFKAWVALEAPKGRADGFRSGVPVRRASDDDPSMEEGAGYLFSRCASAEGAV